MRVSRWLLCVVWCAGGLVVTAPQHLAAQEGTSFRSTVLTRQRETLQAVAAYLEANPQADDADEARTWMLETAVTNGLEGEATGVAEQVLKRPELEPAQKSLALKVLCVGSARRGDLGAAQEAFPMFLRGFRIQMPFPALDTTTLLAARAQLAEDRDALNGFYDAFESHFALNAQATEIVRNRRLRLDLLGKPAPALAGDDVAGMAANWSDYTGKVVLVDFWATNCAPCLAEFPNLKRLYRKHREAGFEIVGVSFDESAAQVTGFAKQNGLEWRQLLNPSGQGPVAAGFQVRTIPALFLVDRQGKVAFVDVRGEELREAIEKLLK